MTHEDSDRSQPQPRFLLATRTGGCVQSEPERVRPRILLLPGLDNSGPRHWQTHWESLSQCSRADFEDWARPTLHQWVPLLDRAVRECPRPLVLAAHSLGCLAVAWWAALMWTEAFADKVQGALLVAPPDVDRVDTDERLRDFRPVPAGRLPFRSILVASRNDPFASFERSLEMAQHWGSEAIDLGEAGHINAEAGLHEWPAGLRLLCRLSGHNPNLLVAELGLRVAMA